MVVKAHWQWPLYEQILLRLSYRQNVEMAPAEMAKLGAEIAEEALQEGLRRGWIEFHGFGGGGQ